MTVALLLICKTNRKSERTAILLYSLSHVTGRSFVMVVKETPSLGFDVQNLKISAGFLQYTHGFSEGFAFVRICGNIGFHFGSDLLGETFWPNGLTTIS